MAILVQLAMCRDIESGSYLLSTRQTPEEGLRTEQPKHRETNNEDVDISQNVNNVNNDNSEA